MAHYYNFTIFQLQTNGITICINNALDTTLNIFKTGHELALC